MDLVIFCPTQLVAAAINKYSSEKLALEAKTSFTAEEENGENSLVSGDNESGKVEEDAASISGAVTGGGEGEEGGGGGEGGEGEKETRTEEGEKEEEQAEEEEEEVAESKRVTSDPSGTYPLPPYHSEVRTYVRRSTKQTKFQFKYPNISKYVQ